MRKYKFILLSNGSNRRLECSSAPKNWDGMKFNILKSIMYFGVFKSISVEFQFVGDGYRFLQQEKLRFGFDANVLLRVYKANKFLFEGKVNYANYVDDRTNKSFQIDIIQSSFVQKFSTREDAKLNIFNNISLDRNAITPTDYKTVQVRGKQIRFESIFEGAIVDENQVYHHIIPFFLKENGNPDVEEVSDQHLDNTPDVLKAPANAVYINRSSIEQTIQIILDARARIFPGPVVLDPEFVEPVVISGGSLRWRLQIFDSNNENELVSTIFSVATSVSDVPKSRSFDYSANVTLQPGEYIVAICEKVRQVEGVDTFYNFEEMEGLNRMEVYYQLLELTIVQDSIFSDSTCPVVLPHELFTNLIAQITGKENAVYSEFFGREELGYDEDGEGAYLAITKGELLRGIPIEYLLKNVIIPGETNEKRYSFTTSFRDAWQSFNSIFNLGILIQNNSIVIEPKADLLNGNIAIDLGEVSDLGIKPATDFIFNSVKAGYPKNEYEQENGRDEFNTEAQYTNSVEILKKELDLMSVYYGDGYGVEFARRESVKTTGSKDSRYDDKIFFLDLIKVDGELITRRLEDIDLLEGVFSPETTINARIAPGQNLLRWQKYLAIPLHRKDKVYFFQSKGKNNSSRIVTPLGSSFDGEDLQLSEGAYFLPEERIFQKPITIDTLFALLENPLGRIRYQFEGETFHDYLFEVDSETEKAKSEWRVLGTKATPVDTESDAVLLDVIKYGDGPTDYIKYGDGPNDYPLYQ
jgi:hypothetical protein